ncbi:MAG: hypothetical protein JWO38_5459 [Gemmataceae bacterium]|nr:hypothetical protein [Gemmataceae bacterium]
MRLTLPSRRRGGASERALAPAADTGFLFVPRMVPVMRRRIAMMSVLGLLAAGLGCKHIGGKCDCTAHPADAVITGPTNPYPYAPAPGMSTPTPIPPAGTSGIKAVPTQMPAFNPARQ